MGETKIHIPPLSMDTITSKLFTHLEKSVITAFGEEGKVLLEQGVENFGYKDAEEIALQATKDGKIHRLYSYIPRNHQAEKKYGNLTILL